MAFRSVDNAATIAVIAAITNSSFNFQNERSGGLPLGEARFAIGPDLPSRTGAIKPSLKDCG